MKGKIEVVIMHHLSGREQAALTGERLKELGLPYSRFVYSTMTRATETANIMREKLGEVEDIDHCDMLREGAPIPPEPPLGSWKPEMHVRPHPLAACFPCKDTPRSWM